MSLKPKENDNISPVGAAKGLLYSELQKLF